MYGYDTVDTYLSFLMYFLLVFRAILGLPQNSTKIQSLYMPLSLNLPHHQHSLLFWYYFFYI